MSHTVTTEPSERRLRVALDGWVIAESSRVLELHETNHPSEKVELDAF